MFTRSALLNNRQDAVIDQAYENARRVEDDLRSNPASIVRTLQLLPGSSSPLVFARGQWSSVTSEFSSESLPQELRDDVIENVTPARMLYRLFGQPVLAVGIPLTAVGASYFEIVSVGEVEDTLNSVGLALAVATAITTSLGLVLGSLAARRAVRPLGDAAQAAKAIAGGRLDTRLEPTEDKDLAQLATAFNDMAAALEDRVERDAQFASDVSHELRSPLMTLSASIEVLQAPARRDARAGRCRPRPAGGRRRPLPGSGGGPVRDLPLRRRRGAPPPRAPPRRRVRPPGGGCEQLPRVAREGGRGGRGDGHPRRQASPGPGDGQPHRQRPLLRGRRGRGERGARTGGRG